MSFLDFDGGLMAIQFCNIEKLKQKSELLSQKI